MQTPSHPSPTSADAAQGQHVDALGNALQVGDVLEYDFFTGEKVTITRLLSNNRFAFADRETERTNFCRCFIRVATAQAPASADACTSHIEQQLASEITAIADIYRDIDRVSGSMSALFKKGGAA